MHRFPPFVFVATGLALAAGLHAQDLVVKAAKVVLAPDSVQSDGAILVRQGKVAFVGAEIPAEARAKATVVDYGDTWLVPGFVLPPNTLGRDRDLAEASLAFTPDLRAVEAFDPWQDELARLPASAVTALLLSPSPRNVAGGIGALVKPGKDGGSVATAETHVALSLTQAARNPERPPTSLMGACDLLRTAFAAAKQGTGGGPDVAVLRQALGGSRRIVIHADLLVELLAALDLAREFGFEPVLVGARDAEKVLPRLVQQKASLVLDPLQPAMRVTQLRLPTRLAEAGVPFCFGGRADQLRLAAVLAVRNGLDRKTALAALTRTPAQMFEQQASVGSLRAGCGADFAVFRGDPLDLGSAHVATFVDGVRVFGDAASPAATPTPATAAGDR
ncbi:MAG: amidohydrolase family protein [Planctomycetes bacterium]|nr:amidohydrolase family protein [Planctomycetota bacterium]